jgi:hypothetical protein
VKLNDDLKMVIIVLKTLTPSAMTSKFLLILCMQSIFCFAQDNKLAEKYGTMVDSMQLKDNLSIIASDALEGRYTGKRGQKMAAAFIAHHFQEIGLEPSVNGSYYQSFTLTHTKQDDIYIKAGGSTFSNLSELVFFGNGITDGEINSDVVFIGKATDLESSQVDIKDKSVMIWIDEISLKTLNNYELAPLKEKCRMGGARNVFFVASKGYDQFLKDIKPYYPRESFSIKKPNELSTLGTFIIRQDVAEKILNVKIDWLKVATSKESTKKQLMKIKPGIVKIKVNQIISEVNTENVLGYLHGSDKKDEVVVVSSHYDHLGKSALGSGDVIHNGADDDGSGTVAVMEIARVFSQAKREGFGPRRSMLFIAFTGEEEGLFGSEYYVNNPIFPLEETIVDLNLDMVGRTDDDHKDNKNFVYVIGADRLSSELYEINERANKAHTQLTFDYTYDNVNHPEHFSYYYGSDHYNFAIKNIPIIFFTNGDHADYHKVSDEVSKIEFEPLTLRTQCVFYTAWEIANREERPKIDKKAEK